jgi:hypothetical protein
MRKDIHLLIEAAAGVQTAATYERMKRRIMKARARAVKLQRETAEIDKSMSELQSMAAAGTSYRRTIHLARMFTKGVQHERVETPPKGESRHVQWNKRLRRLAIDIGSYVVWHDDPKFHNVTPEQIREWLFK